MWILAACVIIAWSCNSKTEQDSNTVETSNLKKVVAQKDSNTADKNSKNITKSPKKANKNAEIVGSGKINWKSIEEVEQLMKSNPKKVVVDAYTSWCGWCKRMDKNTFQHPEIAKYINDNFYAIKFDAETKETVNFKGKDYNFVKGGRKGHNELAKLLLKGRLSYPTISFLNENMDLINAFPGYKAPNDFDALLNYVNNDEFANMGYTQYKSTFNSAIPPLENKKKTTAGKPTFQKKVTVKPGRTNNNIGIKNLNKKNVLKTRKLESKGGN